MFQKGWGKKQQNRSFLRMMESERKREQRSRPGSMHGVGSLFLFLEDQASRWKRTLNIYNNIYGTGPGIYLLVMS